MLPQLFYVFGHTRSSSPFSDSAFHVFPRENPELILFLIPPLLLRTVPSQNVPPVLLVAPFSRPCPGRSSHSLFIQFINKPALYYLVPSDRVLVSVALLQPTQGPLQHGTDVSDGSGSELLGAALHGETAATVMFPFLAPRLSSNKMCRVELL